MTLPAALAHPCYHDDDAARETFEEIRWPDGPYCPHCGCFDTVAPLGGKSMGPGWYWCNKSASKPSLAGRKPRICRGSPGFG
jgi:hypothetical protein